MVAGQIVVSMEAWEMISEYFVGEELRDHNVRLLSQKEDIEQLALVQTEYAL